MLLVVMIVMSNPITTLADNDWPKYPLKDENNSLQRAENYHIIIIISNKMIMIIKAGEFIYRYQECLGRAGGQKDVRLQDWY